MTAAIILTLVAGLALLVRVSIALSSALDRPYVGPPVPRSTAVVPAAPRAVWDPRDVSHFGLEAVTKALRPISVPERRVYSEAEATAWSELAAAFDNEHKQQGWA